MTKKIGNKKLGGVKQASLTQGVQRTDAVNEAESVKGIKSVTATSGVGSVKGAGGIGKNRPTRIMTLEEREALLKTINEEADRLFDSGVLPKGKKEIITKAVKMAVDAGLLANEDEKSNK